MSQAHHERAHELNGKLEELVNMGNQRQAGLSKALKEWKQELNDALAGDEEKRRHYLDSDAVYEAILKILQELKRWVESGDRIGLQGKLLNDWKVNFILRKVDAVVSNRQAAHSLARVSLRYVRIAGLRTFGRADEGGCYL